jgi:hypothetical protein
MAPNFYKRGQIAALRLMKLSYEPDQTYQHKPDPCFTSDPQARGAGIDATWDTHDKRFQTAVRAPADITSQMTGADG